MMFEKFEKIVGRFNDLEKQLVIEPDGSSSGFEVDSFRKTFLLKGLDEIGWTLQYETDIAKYERSQDSG